MREFTGDLVLICRVQKCSQPLRVTLEHDILAPVVEVIYLNDNDRITMQDDTDGFKNTIDFGHTDGYSVYKKNFQIINAGGINISYRAKLVLVVKGNKMEEIERQHLQLSKREGMCDLSNHEIVGDKKAPQRCFFTENYVSKFYFCTLSNLIILGIVCPSKTNMFALTYTPRYLKDKLNNLEVHVDVEFGPRYIFALSGDLFDIDIDFSFDECDFGPVLISRDSPDMGVTVPLIIVNHTRRYITKESWPLQRKNMSNSNLQKVDCSPIGFFVSCFIQKGDTRPGKLHPATQYGAGLCCVESRSGQQHYSHGHVSPNGGGPLCRKFDLSDERIHNQNSDIEGRRCGDARGSTGSTTSSSVQRLCGRKIEHTHSGNWKSIQSWSDWKAGAHAPPWNDATKKSFGWEDSLR